MYQPAHGRFAVERPDELLTDLAARFPATLVTLGEGGFWTSILPMLVYVGEGDHGKLRGHLARGNPHWRAIEKDGRAVAIFNGPDAYVSPAWYEEKRTSGKVVPTWNYTTVVVHGTLTTHHEPEWLQAHVRRLVERHESARSNPWSVDDTPEGYIATQVRAIVGLELSIERVEAKRKLSQNRSLADIRGAIEGLSAGSTRDGAVSADMRAANPDAAEGG